MNKFLIYAQSQIDEYNAEIRYGEPDYPKDAFELIAMYNELQSLKASLKEFTVFQNQAL